MEIGSMNIEARFPTGRVVGDKVLVRKGSYDWPAAVLKDGEWEITDFGRRIARPEPEAKTAHRKQAWQRR